jgi:hypothetical protein
MLLRRVIEHVKTQNWTAIGIDLVIVVLGVFLGIQVSNWNAARTDQEVEARLLRELHADVSADVEEMEVVLQSAEGRVVASSILLEAAGVPFRHSFEDTDTGMYNFPEPLVRRRLEETDRPTFAPDADLLIYTHYLRRLLDGNRHTYNAIVNTGSVRLIADSTLARQIQAYYAHVDDNHNLERYLSTVRDRLEGAMQEAGLSRTGVHSLPEISRAIRATPPLAATISDTRGVALYHWGAVLTLQDEGRRLAEALSAHLDDSGQ